MNRNKRQGNALTNDCNDEKKKKKFERISSSLVTTVDTNRSVLSE